MREAATARDMKSCAFRLDGTGLLTTRGVGLVLSLMSAHYRVRNYRYRFMQINFGILSFVIQGILHRRIYQHFCCSSFIEMSCSSHLEMSCFGLGMLAGSPRDYGAGHASSCTGDIEHARTRPSEGHPGHCRHGPQAWSRGRTSGLDRASRAIAPSTSRPRIDSMKITARPSGKTAGARSRTSTT
ncbi:hypothetical protein P3T25_003853 [Paraburkholderia sp. GAS32]